MESAADANETIYTYAELSQHKEPSSAWLVIHDNVYDVTKFLEEHPGGDDILLEHAGGWATNYFEDVGHSADARQMMKKYRIGRLAKEDCENRDFVKIDRSQAEAFAAGASSWSSFLVPLIIAAVVAVAYSYFFTSTADH